MPSAFEIATELEDRLFLAMLDKTRANAGPEFDLIALCDEFDISADAQTLIAFTADNEGLRGRSNIFTQHIGFYDECGRASTRLSARGAIPLKDPMGEISTGSPEATGSL